jgi:hypothetical protein
MASYNRQIIDKPCHCFAQPFMLILDFSNACGQIPDDGAKISGGCTHLLDMLLKGFGDMERNCTEGILVILHCCTLCLH